MTATLDDVTARTKEPDLSAEAQLLRKWSGRPRNKDCRLTSPAGLLRQLTKTVLQTSLGEELTEHLGDEKHEPAGVGSGRHLARRFTLRTGRTSSYVIDR